MKEKKSFIHYMRSLHRDIGYFVTGFVVIYALSGIVLTYRDTDLLKREVSVEKTLPAGTDPSRLGEILRIRDFSVTRVLGNIVYFKNGSYDTLTGDVSYVTRETYPVVEKLFEVHKAASNDPVHWINVIFGLSLLFLSVSSFWMFKRGSAQLRKGIYISAAGCALALLLVYL